MIERVLESVSKVRLSGGLVGRLCTVLMVVCACVTALGVASKSDALIGAAIATIVFVAVPLLWRLVRFAELNPNVAILDGSEFVRAEAARMKHAAKGSALIPVVIENKTSAQPVLPNEVANDEDIDPEGDA